MTVTCARCKVDYNVPCTPEQYDRWANGALIQNAMPDVPKDLRELLISGMCGKCFDALFPPEEE